MENITIPDFIGLMDKAHEPVIICDANNRISYVNEAALKLLNIERDSIVGSSFDTILHFKFNETDLNLFEFMKDKNNFDIQNGLKLLVGESEALSVSVSVTTTFDVHNQVRYRIVIIKNIDKLTRALDRADMYSSLVEQSKIVMILTDLNWNIQYYNIYFRYKYLNDGIQIIGRNAIEYLFKNANEDLREMIQFYIEQLGSWTTEEKYTLHNQKEIWEEIQIQAVKDNFGNTIRYTIMMKDITNRKNSELHIAQEKRTFEAIFENTTVGLMIIDSRGIILKSNSEALKILNTQIVNVANQSFYNLFLCTQNSDLTHYKCQYCENCIIARTLERVLEKDMSIRGQEIVYTSFKYSSKVDEKEIRYLRMNASPAMINQQKHILVALQDITDMKRISKELIHNERHLRLITDSMLDTIVQVNSENIITFASPSVKTLTGFDVTEVIGEDFRRFIFDEDIEANDIKNGIKKEFEANALSEFQVRHKGGEKLWIQSVGNIVKYEDDMTYVFVLRDITEQMAYRNELKISKKAADEANAAKSLFLANMSHEIRTPMNGIIGMTELTLMTELTNTQRQYLDMVKTSASSLLSIINSILDFSKIEAGKMVADEHIFNFQNFMNETLMPLRVQAASKHINFEYLVSSVVPEFLIGDASKVRQILNNIVYNAIKFTDQGHVYVKVMGNHDENLIYSLKIVVEDTGIGISEDNQKKIFDSFQQADPSATRKYGGTGLGLSISKGLINILGGTLEIRSTLGKGTQVEIILPMMVGNAFGPIGDKHQIEVPEVSRKLKVLVAEDDNVNQILIRKLLSLQGHSCDLAENGFEAVRLFKGQDYDLVILDIQMQVMNGIEAMQKIRELSSEKGIEIPIIAFTAKALSEDKQALLDMGFDDYISKPVTLTHFFRKVMKNTGLLNESNFNFDDIIDRIKVNNVDEIFDLNLVNDKIQQIENALENKDYGIVEVVSGHLKNILKDNTALRRIVLKMELAIRKEDLQAFAKHFDHLREDIGR